MQYQIFVIVLHNNQDFYIIQENVNVSEGTVINVSPDLVAGQLQVRCLAPDGTVMKHGLGYPSYDTGEWIHTEDGNVQVTAICNEIYWKGKLIFSSSNLVDGDINVQEMINPALPTETFVSNTSNNYIFRQVIILSQVQPICIRKKCTKKEDFHPHVIAQYSLKNEILFVIFNTLFF